MFKIKTYIFILLIFILIVSLSQDRAFSFLSDHFTEGTILPSIAKNRLSEEEVDYLENVATDTFNSILYFVNGKTGLPYDSSIRPKHTSISNIGLYLASVAAGTESNLIDRKDACDKIELTLDSLKRIPKWHGFPISWVNVDTLEQIFGTSFSYADHLGNLIAGLLVTKTVFPEYKDRIDNFIDQMDFSITYDENTGWLKGGYDVSEDDFAIQQSWGRWYYNLLAADTRIFSFFGVATGDIPLRHWLNLDRFYKERHRLRYYLPGWEGGGLFMQYLPGIFIEESETSMGESARNFAEVQIIHSRELNSPVWGWSACLSPDGRYLGWGGLEDAVVTPHASILAIEDFPEDVVGNLKKLEDLGVRRSFRGEENEFDFGFRDSYNFKTGEIADRYLVLDQCMIFLSLANFLWDNVIRENFGVNPIIKHGHKLMDEYY